MAGTSWSSTSSYASSFGSLDDEDAVCVVARPADAVGAAAEGSCVKFLCSYGGRIQPRHNDGALRYVGGDNRVLSVHRPSLQLHELLRRLRELCGWDQVCLRCQLPMEDLDALVSVTSDDDLVNLLEEYDAAGKDRLQPLKIRAFLFPRAAPPAASKNAHLSHLRRRQKVSPAAAAASRASPTTTCAPPWWEAPPLLLASCPAAQANLRPQHHDRHAPGPGEARPHRHLVHTTAGTGNNGKRRQDGAEPLFSRP